MIKPLEWRKHRDTSSMINYESNLHVAKTTGGGRYEINESPRSRHTLWYNRDDPSKVHLADSSDLQLLKDIAQQQHEREIRKWLEDG